MRKITLATSALILFLSSCSGGKEEADPLHSISEREFLLPEFDFTARPRGEMNIYEATARAINHSTNARLVTMSKVFEKDLRSPEYRDMLPKIVELGGYRVRYNPDFYFATLGSDLDTRAYEARPQHRNILSATWSLVDFSLAYTDARQRDSRDAMIQGLREKAMQNIASDVKLAFYRLAGAQQIRQDLDALEASLKKALDALEVNPEREKLLSYENALKANMNQVLTLRREAVIARMELSSLMGLDSSVDYRIQVPVDLATQKLNEYSLPDLELKAIDYRRTISNLDISTQKEVMFIREQVSKILPDVEFGFKNRPTFDYFQNQAWGEAGLKISWNLIALLDAFKTAPTREEKESLYKIYSVSVGTAALAEINISYLRYYQALRDFQIVLLVSNTHDDIIKNNKSVEVSNITDLDVVSAKLQALLARSKIYYSFAELKDAEDSLLLSVGVNNFPSFVNTRNIKTITEMMEENSTTMPLKLHDDESLEIEPWTAKDDWLELVVPVEQTKGVSAPKQITPEEYIRIINEKPADMIDPALISPIEEPAKPAKATVRNKPPAPAATVNAVPAGKNTLQVGAYKDESSARTAWANLQEKYPDMKNHGHSIQPVQTSTEGTFYRLLATGQRNSLQALCFKMKGELGGTCIIR